MIAELLPQLFVLLGVVLLFLGTVHALHSRRLLTKVPTPRSASLLLRLRHSFIIGTDSDLKIEFFFLAYLALLALLRHQAAVEEASKMTPLVVIIALLIGFHHRQWLSKWRLKNLVSILRLTSDRKFVFKPNQTTAFVLNNVLLVYLVYLNPLCSLLILLGLFVHEVALETRKNHKLLRRRLHLFDLDFILPKKKLIAAVHRATTPIGLKSLDALLIKEQEPKTRLVLGAFRALLTNDQKAFQDLFSQNTELIQSSADLCYYFGRGLYSLGDLEASEPILRIGWDRYTDDRCGAYLALTLMGRAFGREPDLLLEARGLLEDLLKTTKETRGSIFVHAYYALCCILLSRKFPDLSEPEASLALSHIHRAIRTNEEFLRREELGKMSYSHFRGNELILLDICGYICHRRGESRLAFRILESVLSADNTYPWPYYHIGLIYEDSGKPELARSIYSRIMLTERSQSVLYHLARQRLERQTSSSAVTDVVAS